MPSGVEHHQIHGKQTGAYVLLKPVMPSGVEHFK